MKEQKGNVSVECRVVRWSDECEKIGEERGPLFTVSAQEEKCESMREFVSEDYKHVTCRKAPSQGRELVTYKWHPIQQIHRHIPIVCMPPKPVEVFEMFLRLMART